MVVVWKLDWLSRSLLAVLMRHLKKARAGFGSLGPNVKRSLRETRRRRRRLILVMNAASMHL